MQKDHCYFTIETEVKMVVIPKKKKKKKKKKELKIEEKHINLCLFNLSEKTCTYY